MKKFNSTKLGRVDIDIDCLLNILAFPDAWTYWQCQLHMRHHSSVDYVSAKESITVVLYCPGPCPGCHKGFAILILFWTMLLICNERWCYSSSRSIAAPHSHLSII